MTKQGIEAGSRLSTCCGDGLCLATSGSEDALLEDYGARFASKEVFTERISAGIKKLMAK
jgi:hypothetical protein